MTCDECGKALDRDEQYIARSGDREGETLCSIHYGRFLMNK